MSEHGWHFHVVWNWRKNLAVVFLGAAGEAGVSLGGREMMVGFIVGFLAGYVVVGVLAGMVGGGEYVE